MFEPPVSGLPKHFWALVKEQRPRLLMLDYDGTLAPFVADREKAIPYPGIADLLEQILAAGQSRLVIVTGRAIEDIPPLLSIDPLPEIWGCHGWERRSPQGQLTRMELSDAAQQALEAAWRWGCSADLEKRLEHKPFSVAIHWRGLDDNLRKNLESRANEAWGKCALQGNLQLHPFDGGLELRSPGRNKGDVVRDLLAESSADVLPVYLGDDLTDEDAFKALPAEGVGVLVRREYRQTAANYWLEPPGQLTAFLRDWLDTCRHGGCP